MGNWFKHFKNSIFLVEPLKYCILFSQCTRLLHFDINICYIDQWPKILRHYTDSYLQNCTRWGVVLLSRLDNIYIWSVLRRMLQFRLYTYMKKNKMLIHLNGKFLVYSLASVLQKIVNAYRQILHPSRIEVPDLNTLKYNIYKWC